MQEPSLIAALRRAFSQVLRRAGWWRRSHGEKVGDLADAALDALEVQGMDTGGAAAERRRQRDASIAAAFDGRNHQELASRHGLSVRQVRRIVDRRRPGSAANDPA